MNYISTRGAGFGERHTFSDILLGGLAKVGGQYLPAEYPRVTAQELTVWRTLSYADLAYEILRKFSDDIPGEDLRSLTRRTYTAGVYSNVRDHESASQITPLKTLGEEGGTTVSLLELSNGPTLAFKDMAMQLLGNLFEYTLAKQGERVFMLSPHQKMSAFQTAQMFSLQDPNIFNLAVVGNFDNCQDIVKAVSNDHAFKAANKIGTVNSINWARVVAQVVYYFKGYFAATKSNAERVSFTVPSGNFGNVCAGHIARMMGLPIEQLVVATNENDVLDEFFRTGIYRVRTAAETYHTTSPSMDISKASNFERFVFDLLGRDPARVLQLFRDVEEKGGFDLAASGDFARVKEFGFVSGRSSHADRVDTIRDAFKRYGTMIDTHTADGLKVAREHLTPGVPMIVLETAQPIKFGETIREALEREPERPAAFIGIEELPQKFDIVAAEAGLVKAYIAERI